MTINDDEWDQVSGFFDDEAVFLEWEIPVRGGPELVSEALRTIPVNSWFDEQVGRNAASKEWLAELARDGQAPRGDK